MKQLSYFCHVLRFLLLSYSLTPDWGDHFSFENETGSHIDSLKITVGDVENTIVAYQDSLDWWLSGNIDVPESGYPHRVGIMIYSNGDAQRLKADDFDCYQCDGNHQYTLTKEKAEYQFRP